VIKILPDMKYFSRSFLTSLLILSGLLANAQITHRDLLKKFPLEEIRKDLIARNEWRPLPKTVEEWHSQLPDSVVKAIIHRGELALPKAFEPVSASVTMDFARNGDRTRYEAVFSGKRSRLFDLVLAEAVEGKGRFSEQIMNGIWSICEESYWGLSAHLYLQKAGPGLPDVQEPTVDLLSAETASLLAWTDYLIGPTLNKISPLIRPRITYEVQRRVLTPLRTKVYPYMGGGKEDVKLNNWDPWIMMNYMTANLLLEPDENLRVVALGKAMKYIDLYINGLGDDGSCEEGPGYWSLAGATVFDALNLIDKATDGKINLYKDPFVQKIGSYIYKTHIDGQYFINVADGRPKFLPNGLMLYRFGKAINDPVLTAFGSWVFRENPYNSIFPGTNSLSRNLFGLISIVDCAKYPPKQPELPSVWLADVELMAARATNGLYLAAHGGNNGESHNHDDVGDFIIYYKGKPVVIDVGSGQYTARTFSAARYSLWFNASAYHNLPTINGYQQGSSDQYKASNVKFIKDGGQSALAMNIGTAYPAEAGINTWTRTARQVKDGVLIKDEYRVKVLNTLTQSLMTTCDADLSTLGKIIFSTGNDQVTLNYQGSQWTVKKEKMPLDQPEDAPIKKNWDGRDIWRIVFTAKQLKNTGELAFLFH
jgi:hypothetical protein